MAGRARSLQFLQQTDLELTEAVNRLTSVVSSLREPEELAKAVARAGELEQRGAEDRRRLRRRELDLEAVREKLASEEARLYGGAVTQPRELAGLEQEVQALKRHRSLLENEVLELMLAQEEAEADLAEMRQRLRLLEQKWERDRAALLAEEGQLRQRINKLEATRQDQTASLKAEDLASYEDLRARKGGQAVAAVETGVCGGCGVAVPPSQVQRVLRGKDLVRCDNCERFLVAEGA